MRHIYHRPCFQVIMLIMSNPMTGVHHQQHDSQFQTIKAVEGALSEDENQQSLSIFLVSRNKLRRRIMGHLRRNRFPQGNRLRAIPPKLLASCLNKQSLVCMVCLDLLLLPVLLSCGHSFCHSCIENLNQASNQNRCSLCRSDNALPFYEPDRTISNIMEIIRHTDMTSPDLKDYKTRQRALKRQLAKRGAECYIRIHDEIKIRVKNNWLKARVISIVETKQNTYYQVQTNTQERYHINCKSVNILAKEEDLARSREMTPFLENANSARRSQPFREISNTYDIQDILEANSCPSYPRSFPLQSHSSLFFEPQLYSFDGFNPSISSVI